MNPAAALTHANARLRVAMKGGDAVEISRARIRYLVAALDVAIEDGVDGEPLEAMLVELRAARHQHARLCHDLGIYAAGVRP